jgi:hypothetical protein
MYRMITTDTKKVRRTANDSIRLPVCANVKYLLPENKNIRNKSTDAIKEVDVEINANESKYRSTLLSRQRNSGRIIM